MNDESRSTPSVTAGGEPAGLAPRDLTARRDGLIVIRATPEELEAHERLMAEVRSKSKGAEIPWI